MKFLNFKEIFRLIDLVDSVEYLVMSSLPKLELIYKLWYI